MLINLIYIAIAGILIFVLYLAVKAITRGVEAKNDIKEEIEEIKEINSDENISDEILKLKKLLDNGTIDEEEFKKAKDKILNNYFLYAS